MLWAMERSNPSKVRRVDFSSWHFCEASARYGTMKSIRGRGSAASIAFLTAAAYSNSGINVLPEEVGPITMMFFCSSYRLRVRNAVSCSWVRLL